MSGFVVDAVIAGASPDGLMVACELGLAGIRPVILDPMPGPNPAARVNRIVGQAARILDHRDLYSALTGIAAPTPAPHANFTGLPLDLWALPASQLFAIPVQQRGLVQVLAERAGEYGADGGTSKTRHLAGIEFPGMSS